VKPHAKATPSEPTQSCPGRLAWIPRVAQTRDLSAEEREASVRRSAAAARRAIRCVLPAVLIALMVAFALPLASAFACGKSESKLPAPQFEPQLREEKVYATRAHILGEVLTDSVALKWQSEYATSPEGPWVVSGNGITHEGEEGASLGKFPYVASVFLGTAPGSNSRSQALIRHLVPSTTYYACFHAENEHGAAEDLFTFTTAAVAHPEIIGFGGFPTSSRSATFHTQIEGNGTVTDYHFEYAPEEGGHAPAENSALWVPFTSGASGTITVAGEFATPEAKLTGLAPETTYYARVRASNVSGEVKEVEPFTTLPARPVTFVSGSRNITDTSAHLAGILEPHGSETDWRFEYATSENGPWTPVAGAEGTVSQAEAEAFPGNIGPPGIEGSLTGLNPATVYYVRLFAKNEAGEADMSQGIASFETFGPPAAATFAVHGIHGEATRIMGSVNPSSTLTSGEQMITVQGAPTGGTFTLTFKGQTTEPIPFNAPAAGESGSVEQALGGLSTVHGNVFVGGRDGGPYTVFFFAANGEVAQPQITADSAGLTPSGTVTVATVHQGGEAYDTHYHFEYVSQKQFEEVGGAGGFAKALSTPEVDAGSGDSPVYAGADLPGLQTGETYRFRIVATNDSLGDPVVDGEAQSLTVPIPPATAPAEAAECPNAVLRIGPSAQLPDCRAFELLTPIEKGGTQEIFNYGGGVEKTDTVGDDGEHLEYASDLVKWGAAPRGGLSPYVFDRTATGWQMTAAAAQPEGGIYQYNPQLFNSELTELAFDAEWRTSSSSFSPRTEYRVGPAGGPYVTVASVPVAEAEPGWVAASGDFSKLVLQVADHALLGHSTHTVEGDDLYEYAGGELRQVNVTGAAPGATIGTCGATIARGERGNDATPSSLHAVSSDGSRIFFEAVPTGESCGAAEHLYMRVNGAETVDLGPYRFLQADALGSKVLLEKSSGEDPGLYLYEAASGQAKLLPSSGVAVGANLIVSEDLSAVYILAGDERSPSLYRYDVTGGKLGFVTHLNSSSLLHSYTASPDGRYFYFEASTVAGLPGGEKGASQVYRYDSAEAVVECVSCASPFNPEPGLVSVYATGGHTTASAGGEYVFFDATAALVPSDVDGEVAPGSGGEHTSDTYSVSSDVYEWRRDGLDGCTHVQGCLALITSGRGGFLNILLGASSAGRDVFFATNESLLPRDDDTASDIYDARIDGGFPEPAHKVECEGDACSTPFAAPNDLTPSSATFQGAGDVLAPPQAGDKPKAKKPTKPKRTKKKIKPKPKPKAKRGRKSSRANRRDGGAK
jgi:hypothetical protein